MAESNNEMTWESDNVFVPKYVPKNLKWFEKYGQRHGTHKTNAKNFQLIQIFILQREKLLILTL